jgi:hypothetical protein
MRRIILEWGLILSVGMALALSTLWIFSKFFDRSTYHLRIPTSRSVGDDLHLLVGDGDLALCDQFDVDTSGKVRPLIIERRMLVPADILRGDRLGQLTTPGLDIRYYRFGPSGYLIWSLRLSLLIPVVLLSFLAFWFRHHLRRLRRRTERGLDRASDLGSQQVNPATSYRA